ncbi:MAG: flagellar motor switch protein FliN [Rhizobiaceae bacterium]|jgi:flagellar motor switch protein FliN/FliY
MSQATMAETGESEEQLNRAIEELRGVLHEDKRPHARPAEAQAAMPADGQPSAHSVIMDIPVEVQIVLGSSQMSVSDLMALQRGSTVALDRRIGEPVEVTVNGRMIARGEITVLESDPSRFGIRLTEIVASRPA